MKFANALAIVLLLGLMFVIVFGSKKQTNLAEPPDGPQTDSSGLDGFTVESVPLQLFDVNQLAYSPDGSNQ